MQELQIQVDDTSEATRVVRLSGPLTLNTLFEFQDLVRKGGNTRDLIIQLADVPYMDSAGLGSLLGALASCQSHGRKFALANVSDRVVTMLKVAGVDTIVPRYETSEIAAKQMAAKA
jgi:anti-sigma B factor antagonist